MIWTTIETAELIKLYPLELATKPNSAAPKLIGFANKRGRTPAACVAKWWDEFYKKNPEMKAGKIKRHRKNGTERKKANAFNKLDAMLDEFILECLAEMSLQEKVEFVEKHFGKVHAKIK